MTYYPLSDAEIRKPALICLSVKTLFSVDLRSLALFRLGLGFVLLALGINEPDAMGPLMGTAAFPSLIGVAHLIMWRYGARR